MLNFDDLITRSNSELRFRIHIWDFSENDKIESCNSPYATSKMAMELFARTYHQLYGLSLIGLRFFTVYGPRGRPDMAPYKFLNAIHSGKPFQKYGEIP